MSRRRYISTEISVDKRIRRLSDAAALLYTWMIPHAEEDATLTADPEELLALVVPNRPGWTLAKMQKCIDEIAGQELFSVHDGLLYFPPPSFYRYQSNIQTNRRRLEQPLQTDINSTEQHRTAQNSASPSPSPSPSTHMSGEFDSFWSAYPRKDSKGTAREAYVKARKKVSADEIMVGVSKHLPVWRKTERRYIPMPATWLNQERWEDEPADPGRPPLERPQTFELPSLEGCVPCPENLRDLMAGVGRDMP